MLTFVFVVFRVYLTKYHGTVMIYVSLRSFKEPLVYVYYYYYYYYYY